jgi:hypothetical protein
LDAVSVDQQINYADGSGTVSPNIPKINNKIPFSASGPDIMLIQIAFTAAQGDQPVRVSGIFFDNISIPYYVHNNSYEGRTYRESKCKDSPQMIIMTISREMLL